MKKELNAVRNELNALIFHVRATPNKYITISQPTMLTFLLSIRTILEKEVFEKAESFDEMCQHDEKIINAFNNGEWCDTNDICRLLKISFADGLKCFDFSRTAEWNAAPLEGQKITTKFRIKQNPEPPKGE